MPDEICEKNVPRGEYVWEYKNVHVYRKRKMQESHMHFALSATSVTFLE